MNKKINSISIFVIWGILVLSQTVYAANPTLSFLPAIASENVGTVFNLKVQVNPQGNKACVVEGTLGFNNLTCKSIALAPNLIAQTTPTCTNPNFIIGIPKCSTAPKEILTISVQSNKVGQAKASFAKSSIIGVGVLIHSDGEDGAYNITAIRAAKPKALFDVISGPVQATKSSLIPFVILSVVMETLLILLIIFLARRIRMHILKRRIKKESNTASLRI
jgi:hypothetical protein